MKKLTFQIVFKQMPNSLAYFFTGFFVSILFGYFIFYFNKSLYETILSLWSKRLLFGLGLFGNNYSFWFVLNNIIVLFLIIVASILMIFLVMRRKNFGFSSRPKIIERRHPKITLISLYMIPIGALIINGFLIGLFLTYIFLNYDFHKFIESFLLILPHGINEILALVLATSLSLTYIKILSPLILNRKWDACRKKGKELLVSKVTLFVVCLIAILVLFSGFIEGLLTLLIVR